MSNPSGYFLKWLSTIKRIAGDSKTSSGVTAIHIFCSILGFIISKTRHKEIVYDIDVNKKMSEAIESRIALQVSLGCSCVCIPLILDYFLDAVQHRNQVNFGISQWNLLLSVIAPCVVYYAAVMSLGSASIGNVR